MKFFSHKSSGKVMCGTTIDDDKPRADMYWPAWYLVLGLLLVVWGIIAGILTCVLQFSVFLVVMTLSCLLVGVATLLGWKNQAIRMLSDDVFEYSTFLGNKKQYSFEEITELRRDCGSRTLFVGGEKLKIDSCAIITERLKNRVNQQLKENGCKEIWQ